MEMKKDMINQESSCYWGYVCTCHSSSSLYIIIIIIVIIVVHTCIDTNIHTLIRVYIGVHNL